MGWGDTILQRERERERERERQREGERERERRPSHHHMHFPGNSSPRILTKRAAGPKDEESEVKKRKKDVIVDKAADAEEADPTVQTKTAPDQVSVFSLE